MVGFVMKRKLAVFNRATGEEKIHMNKLTSLVLAATVLACMSACRPTAGVSPNIAIQKTNPSGDEALAAGQLVDLSLQVLAYHVPDKSTAALVVQDANKAVLAMDGPYPVLGGASVEFHAKFKVPETTSIQIFTPLYLDGKDQTNILDTRVYRVVGRLSQ
jgi:hypothetical protein